MENGMHLLKASTWIRHLEKREKKKEGMSDSIAGRR